MAAWFGFNNQAEYLGVNKRNDFMHCIAVENGHSTIVSQIQDQVIESDLCGMDGIYNYYWKLVTRRNTYLFIALYSLWHFQYLF